MEAACGMYSLYTYYNIIFNDGIRILHTDTRYVYFRGPIDNSQCKKFHHDSLTHKTMRYLKI